MDRRAFQLSGRMGCLIYRWPRLAVPGSGARAALARISFPPFPDGEPSVIDG